MNLKKFMWNIKELKFQIIRLYFSGLPLSSMRVKFLKKHKIFKEMGENVFWQPRILPVDADRIKIHNNVAIATDVRFIMHDVAWMVMKNLPDANKESNHIVGYKGCCEIFDNVFIGANAIILPNVKIGPNAIIGAGAIVTKDVLPGTIVGGVPARKIGLFDDFIENRWKYGNEFVGLNEEERDMKQWERFYNQ